MSGNRKCQVKDCKVRVCSELKMCEEHESTLESQNITIQEAAEEVMQENAPLLKRLAEYEAREKALQELTGEAQRLKLGYETEEEYIHAAHKQLLTQDWKEVACKNTHAAMTRQSILNLTLPTDSESRKEYPLLRGCLRYFPAALAGVALVSKQGNDKHNPGQELHHSRNKSGDHGDCIVRHLLDVQDLLAQLDQVERSALTPKGAQELLTEVSSLAWRALAYSQELHEKYGNAPLAPGAKKD